MKKCICCKAEFIPKHKTSEYCSRSCVWKVIHKKQDKHETWWLNQKGYIEGRVWDNGKHRQVKKARWVMELHLGRRLTKLEIVHHINENKLDNRIENLEVMEYGKHTTHHTKGKPKRSGYKMQLSDAERARRSAWMSEVHRRKRMLRYV